MLIEADLEQMSLSSLYELMSFKIEELKAIKNLYAVNQEQKQRTDIEILQKVINAKKIRPIK